ncbi:hypothetical protein DR046_20420 [Jannaschia formosa]|nr:hypothetical protein DR046_20420 [Jannaschia formosa]
MISGEDAEAWARHAHPVSVWTRILLGLPLLILAGWSRVWIGPWWIAGLAAAIFFIWINPRMTPVPRSTDNWGSRSTLGERLWLRMTREEVPPWHRTVPRVLMVGSALGHAVLLYGVVFFDPWLTLVGYATGMLCKLWYLDRMVWLERDIRQTGDDQSRFLTEP